MARCPSLQMWIASLIHLVGLSESLSITDASAQFITWFSCRAWSVRANLLYSVEVPERWLLVKARLVFDSTSVLYSCNLTPSHLPVSPTCFIAVGAWDPVHTFQCLLYLHFILWMRQNASESLIWFHGTWCIVFSHDPSNSLRSSLYVGNHHWWSRLRLVLFFFCLSSSYQIWHDNHLQPDNKFRVHNPPPHTVTQRDSNDCCVDEVLH